MHAFSPLEVWHGAASLRWPPARFLAALAAAGLGSLPGTAAEVLCDAVRAVICPDKLTSAQWLQARGWPALVRQCRRGFGQEPAADAPRPGRSWRRRTRRGCALPAPSWCARQAGRRAPRPLKVQPVQHCRNSADWAPGSLPAHALMHTALCQRSGPKSSRCACVRLDLLAAEGRSACQFGHVEGAGAWARHLVELRALQARTGGITEFVPLPFVHMEAPIYLRGARPRPPAAPDALCQRARARRRPAPVPGSAAQRAGGSAAQVESHSVHVTDGRQSMRDCFVPPQR